MIILVLKRETLLSTSTICGQPIGNDGNWGQWTFFVKTYLSEKADVLKKQIY